MSYVGYNDVLRKLREEAKRLGSNKALAKAAGVSPQFVSDCLAERRPPTGALLAFLGFVSVTHYVYTHKAIVASLNIEPLGPTSRAQAGEGALAPEPRP